MQEDIIQGEIVKWFRSIYSAKKSKPFGVIFSVPNGGKRGWFDAKQLQATGLLAGVTDLIVLINGKVHFVEIKTSTGRMSEVQKRFKLMLEMAGFGGKWYLVRSLEEFKELVKLWHEEEK